jgi:glycosyltransferase involved in cell wall biosynthesis
MGINIDHRVIAFRGIDIEKNSKMAIYKGISYLLEALEIYVPNEPTTLLIFENGKCFQFLSSKYNILTLGWIDGEELALALSAADIFLMPSIQESFGLMAVEAMASGTPVIVFEGTSLPDVIKAPFGGVAVKAKNSKKLAEAIEQLLDNDELRIRLSKQARLIVENEYAFPLYVNRHITLYEDVIKSHQKIYK